MGTKHEICYYCFMPEKPQQPHQDDKETKRKWLPSLSEIITKYRKGKELEQEQSKARDLTEWTLMKFTSGNVKASKRAIYPNQFQENIKIWDLIDKDASVLRIEGDYRNKKENIFWFILVNVNGSFYVTHVNTHGVDMETLEPRVEGYEMPYTDKIKEEKISESFPIEFTINFLFSKLYDEDISTTRKIDVMFSGSPETSKSASERQRRKALQLATEGK